MSNYYTAQVDWFITNEEAHETFLEMIDPAAYPELNSITLHKGPKSCGLKVNGYEIFVMCTVPFCYEEVGGHPELNKYTYGDISDDYDEMINEYRSPDGDEPDIMFGFYIDGSKKALKRRIGSTRSTRPLIGR